MSEFAKIEKFIEKNQDKAVDVSRKIWEYAELSHEETRSAELLCHIFEEEGFSVERGVCGKSSAFVATYGSGKPVIGLLGEYDALPNLSQKAGITHKEARNDTTNGHGCGHNLIGAGAMLAAISVKDYLEETGIKATIRYYGCAGEENIGVKPLMAKEGLFRDTDCVFAWHPETTNSIQNLRHYAVKLFQVEFHGTPSHAGSAPELGRSALDACELMNVGCNYLREHVVQDARIHYAYTDAGGTACNVVPDHAMLTYGVRALKLDDVDEIIQRIKDVARGAALMTGTTVDIHPPLFGYSDFFQNSVISGFASEAMAEVGAPVWSEEDFAKSAEYLASYDTRMRNDLEKIVHARYPQEQWAQRMEKPLDTTVRTFVSGSAPIINAGSTDVGDVAYVTPTAYIFVACSCMASPSHSWFWTSSVGSEIGQKGMVTAAKILALSCVKAIHDPEKLKAAREEWLAVTGGRYHCPV